jgi:hypothetical protein
MSPFEGGRGMNFTIADLLIEFSEIRGHPPTPFKGGLYQIGVVNVCFKKSYRAG